MSESQMRRIAASLSETKALLEKEMGYAPDLRKPETVAFLGGHAAKLEEMLEAGKAISPFHDKDGNVIGLPA